MQSKFDQKLFTTTNLNVVGVRNAQPLKRVEAGPQKVPTARLNTAGVPPKLLARHAIVVAQTTKSSLNVPLMSATSNSNTPQVKTASLTTMNANQPSTASKFLGLFGAAPRASLATARASAQMNLGSASLSGVNSMLGLNAGLARAQAHR